MVGWANGLPRGCDVARRVTGGRLSTRLVVGVVVGVGDGGRWSLHQRTVHKIADGILLRGYAHLPWLVSVRDDVKVEPMMQSGSLA